MTLKIKLPLRRKWRVMKSARGSESKWVMSQVRQTCCSCRSPRSNQKSTWKNEPSWSSCTLISNSETWEARIAGLSGRYVVGIQVWPWFVWPVGVPFSVGQQYRQNEALKQRPVIYDLLDGIELSKMWSSRIKHWQTSFRSAGIEDWGSLPSRVLQQVASALSMPGLQHWSKESRIQYIIHSNPHADN